MSNRNNNVINEYEKSIEQIKAQMLNTELTPDQRMSMIDFIGRTRDLINAEEDRLKEKLNNDFIQLYRKNIEAVVELGKKNQLASLIFIYLLKHIDKNNVVVVSQKALCDVFDVERTSIWRAQKILENANFVQVIKIGTATAYAINSEIAWTTHANKKKFAYFTANVIATETEQESIKKVKVKSVKTNFLSIKKLDKNHKKTSSNKTKEEKFFPLR